MCELVAEGIDNFGGYLGISDVFEGLFFIKVVYILFGGFRANSEWFKCSTVGIVNGVSEQVFLDV